MRNQNLLTGLAVLFTVGAMPLAGAVKAGCSPLAWTAAPTPFDNRARTAPSEVRGGEHKHSRLAPSNSTPGCGGRRRCITARARLERTMPRTHRKLRRSGTNAQVLGENLRRLRIAAGYDKQAQLGDAMITTAGPDAGLPSRIQLGRQISSWETGRHVPSSWYVNLLREVLGCTRDELLGTPSATRLEAPGTVAGTHAVSAEAQAGVVALAWQVKELAEATIASVDWFVSAASKLKAGLSALIAVIDGLIAAFASVENPDSEEDAELEAAHGAWREATRWHLHDLCTWRIRRDDSLSSWANNGDERTSLVRSRRGE
jgi:transcriptional regulator with XRE-family HTH domain